MKRMVMWLAVMAMGVALGGCEAGAPARDFDELVPRLLSSISGRSPEDAARKLFDVTSPDERRDAIAYLETRSYGHEAAYMRAYELLATDPYAMVRAQAMRALGSSGQAEVDYKVVGDKKVVDFLLDGLNDKDVQVKRDAAYGLETTWSDQAAAAVMERLKNDPDDQVRVFCAWALGRAREADAYYALIGALKDRDAAVVRYAYGSLVSATEKDFSYDYAKWLDWYQGKYLKTGAGGGAGGTGVEAPGAGGATMPTGTGP